MPDINRCPVCGSEMSMDEIKPWVRLRCTGCPLDFGRYWFESAELLINSWNNWTGRDGVKTVMMSRNRKLNGPAKIKAYEKLFTRR